MSVDVCLTGSKAVVSVHGRFVFAIHSAFRKSTQGLLERSDIEQIEIDLTHADYLDSAGLGMLLLLQERAQKLRKQPVRIVGSSGRVRGVLDMCNFDQLFELS